MKTSCTTLLLMLFLCCCPLLGWGQLDCGNINISNVINCTANSTPIHICGSTIGQTNTNSVYSNGSFVTTTATGPEDIFFINLNNYFQFAYQNITIDIELFNFSGQNLDLFLLDGCNPNSLIAKSTTSNPIEIINIELGATSFTENLVLAEC